MHFLTRRKTKNLMSPRITALFLQKIKLLFGKAGRSMKAKRWWAAAGGAGAGLLNGLLGAGGGTVVVPLLSVLGVQGKKSHATALMVIVPLSLVSAVLYLIEGRFTVGDAWPYLPGCLIGALLGSWLLPRIATGWLKLVFGGLLLWGGIRLLV